MNEQNQKPEWFTLVDNDRGESRNRVKKSAKVTLLLLPIIALISGVAYANLHLEPAANADSPTIVENSAAPIVENSAAPIAAHSVAPVAHGHSVSGSTLHVSLPPKVSNQEDDAAPLLANRKVGDLKKPARTSERSHESHEGGEGDD